MIGIDGFSLTTGSGNDTIIAGNLDDTIITGAGNDRISVGLGHDNVDGGTGNDTLIVDYSANDNSAPQYNGTQGISSSQNNGAGGITVYRNTGYEQVIFSGIENFNSVDFSWPAAWPWNATQKSHARSRAAVMNPPAMATAGRNITG